MKLLQTSDKAMNSDSKVPRLTQHCFLVFYEITALVYLAMHPAFRMLNLDIYANFIHDEDHKVTFVTSTHYYYV